MEKQGELMKTRKIKLGVQQLRAGIEPDSFNEENNTVDVIWTTGARVKRSPFFSEPFFEELSLKKAHVNLDRLNKGAPLLNNHNSRDLNDIIGVVQTAKIRNEDGKRVGVATVKLSERDEVQGLVKDIKAGVIRNISVGYRINKFEELKDRVDDLPVFRVVDWTPMELSFVGIPADAGAQSRSEESTTNECEIINQEGENSMKTETKNQRLQDKDLETRDGVPVAVDEEAEKSSEETSESPKGSEESKDDSEEVKSDEAEKSDEKADAPSADSEDDKASPEKDEEERSEKVQTGTESADAIRAERERGIEIRSAVKTAGLDESVADQLVKDGATIDEARKQIFKQMEETTSTRTSNQRIEVGDMDQRQLRKEAAVRGIMHVANPSKVELKDGDRQFCHSSPIDIARSFLAAEGVNTSAMTKKDIAERALHTSSDFKAVLSDSCNKNLLEGYDEVPSTFELFTKERIANDFKNITAYRLTTGGILRKVNEHGEYKRGKVSESSEQYKVDKYGEIIGNTWEMMINDDLDAFTDIPRQLGAKAKRTENETFWALLLGAGPNFNGQVMGDGTELFHADHGNLGTPAAIAIPSLGEHRKLLRRQLDESGKRLNLMAKYLVVPAELETLADQFLSLITPNNAGQANPFSQSMTKVVEPILDDSSAQAWYALGSKEQGPMAEIARLGGDRPEIFLRTGFDVDGEEMKIRHVFGMRIMDHRQFTKNAGL